VLAVIDDKNEVKLKTLYVSPHELRAWLPSDLWSEHRLRYKFVVRTSAGQCIAEVLEDD
jgi:hypothetical protein